MKLTSTGITLFFGVPESASENCEHILLEILHGTLPTLDSRTFERAHRIGPRIEGRNRAILAKFHHFKDNDIVSRLKDLKFRQFRVSTSDDWR